MPRIARSSNLLSLALLIAVVGAPVAALAQSGGARPQAPSGGDRQPQDSPRRGGGGGGGFGGMGGFGGGRMFDVSVTTVEMDRYGKMLGLDKQQQEAVKLLHDAYAADFAAQADKMRTKMEDMRQEAREAQDPSMWQQMGEEMQKFRTKRTEMENAFFDDVKAVLTPAQAEKWPTVERTRRRESTIGRGLMSGERVDLVKVVDDLKLSDAAKAPLNAVLDQYSADLDRELVARNAVYDEAQNSFRDMFTGNMDQAKMTKTFEDGRAAALKVRDVNNRFARQIEPLLPEDKRAAFADTVRRESFPTVYRTSQATRVVEAAPKIDTLTAEQKQIIQSIVDTFNRESAAINKQLETAIVEREASIKPDEIMGRFGMGGGGGGGGRGGFGGGMFDSEKISELRTQRRDLETATVDKIRAALTEEQQAELPQRGGDRGDAGGGDGRGGDQGDQPRQRRNRDGQTPRRPGNDQTPPPNQRT